MLGSLGIYATMFKFSRDMEREADQLGFASRRRARLRPAGRRRPVGPHAARGKHADRSTATARCSPPTRRPRNASPTSRPPRRRCRTAATAQRRAIPRGDAALPRELAGAELAQRRYDSSILVIQELLDERAAGRRGPAHLLSRRGVSPPRRGRRPDQAPRRSTRSASHSRGAPPRLARTRLRAARSGRHVPARVPRCDTTCEVAPEADDRAFVQRAT